MPLSLTLLSAAAHASPPVIDIDGTLVLQLALFGLLFLVLRQLVFRPHLALRRERSALVDGARAEAGQLTTQGTTAAGTHAQRLAAARQAASAQRAAQRLEAETAAQQQVAAARRAAEERLIAARTALNQSAPATALALRARADQLAAEIAAKVLGRRP
ncbi:MAG: hypothetical protein IPL40_03390 [Proteobacteria bacterium]|nr:hypothetical protein [Pseudomonadota bacterium]